MNEPLDVIIIANVLRAGDRLNERLGFEQANSCRQDCGAPVRRAEELVPMR